MGSCCAAASSACRAAPSRETASARLVVGPLDGVAEQRLVGGGGRRVQRVGVGQPVVLGRRSSTSSPSAGLGPLDLLQAAAQVLGLAGPLAGLGGQLGQLGLHLLVLPVGPLVGGQQVGELRAAEPVQRLALPAGPQQLLLVGLAVHGDQVLGQVGEQGHRDRPAARRGPGPALGADRAAQQQRAALVVQVAAGLLDLPGHRAVRVDAQPALDRRPVGAGPDPGRVGPAAEQQAQAGDDHRLARAGLAGDHVEAGRRTPARRRRSRRAW